MIKTKEITGTTIGLQTENNNAVAINLLGAEDITHLLTQIAKQYPTIAQDINNINKKLSRNNFTILYKSYIGNNIYFDNNNIENKY